MFRVGELLSAYAEEDYLFMNFLPFLITIPLKLLLTRWPARLNTGSFVSASSVVMPFTPVVTPLTEYMLLPVLI